MATIVDTGRPAAVIADTRISHLAFKRRWPRAKWREMLEAVDTTPMLRDAFDSFRMAKWIDLADDDTIAIVTALTAAQVPVAFRLTAPEATAILSDPVQARERP